MRHLESTGSFVADEVDTRDLRCDQARACKFCECEPASGCELTVGDARVSCALRACRARLRSLSARSLRLIYREDGLTLRPSCFCCGKTLFCAADNESVVLVETVRFGRYDAIQTISTADGERRTRFALACDSWSYWTRLVEALSKRET